MNSAAEHNNKLIKIFIWRLANDGPATKVNCWLRKIAPNNLCDICGQRGGDGPFHAVVCCPHAHDLLLRGHAKHFVVAGIGTQDLLFKTGLASYFVEHNDARRERKADANIVTMLAGP